MFITTKPSPSPPSPDLSKGKKNKRSIPSPTSTTTSVRLPQASPANRKLPRRVQSSNNTIDQIIEYKEQIEMLKEDLAVMRNVINQQGETIKSLEKDRVNLKEELNLFTQLSPTIKPDATPVDFESPRRLIRLKKKNKELQKLYDALQKENEELKLRINDN